MLHGGGQSSLKPVGAGSLSWQRSRRMMHEIQQPLGEAGVHVALLRYRVKGWNASHSAGTAPAPVTDARWALEELTREHPGVPLVLLGHSMGARTAVAVAGHPAVTGVVALAPWFPPGEPVRGLLDKRLYAAHGRMDRITSARATAAFVKRARAAGAVRATFTDMGPVGHYMLRSAGRWNEVAVQGCLDLLGLPSWA
jgi:dienelactone hydrolase